MKSVLLALVVCCSPLVASGCASSPAQSKAVGEASAYAAPEIFGDLERQEFGKQLQVHLPAKLAVSDVSDDWPPDTTSRRLVQAIRGLSEDTTTYSDVVSVAAATVYGDGPLTLELVEGLRTAAAAHQADLQLVVQRRETVDRDTNALVLFKLLILPMLFLPTEENRVILSVHALVRDVRNGLVYTTFDDHRETELVSSQVAEDADIRTAHTALWDESVRDLRESLARKLPALERASR